MKEKSRKNGDDKKSDLPYFRYLGIISMLYNAFSFISSNCDFSYCLVEWKIYFNTQSGEA